MPAEGSVLREADPDWCAARAAYESRFRSVGARGDPLVVLTLGRDQGPARQGPAAIGSTRGSSLA